MNPKVHALAMDLLNVKQTLSPTKTFTHAPGIRGLPGGYPVILSSQGAQLDLPHGISVDEAVKINQEAGTFDGIKNISDDGRVTFTDSTVEIMQEMLGFSCTFFYLMSVKI